VAFDKKKDGFYSCSFGVLKMLGGVSTRWRRRLHAHSLAGGGGGGGGVGGGGGGGNGEESGRRGGRGAR